MQQGHYQLSFYSLNNSCFTDKNKVPASQRNDITR